MSHLKSPSRRQHKFRFDGGMHASAVDTTILGYFCNLVVGSPLLRRDSDAYPDYPMMNRTVRAVIAALGARKKPAPNAGSVRLWAQLLSLVDRTLPRPKAVVPPGEPILTNLRLVASLAGLSEVETELLQFLIVHRVAHQLRGLTAMAGPVSDLGAAELLAAALARSREELLLALSPKGRLMTSGLVTVDDDPMPLEEKVVVRQRLVNLLILPKLSREQFLEQFVPIAPPPTLGESDFRHLEAERAFAQRLLTEALRARTRGINVLLYGATGTGKTELARLLAQTLGASLHLVGREDENGRSAESYERLSSLLLGNRLLDNGAAILLFDELEDLFSRDNLGGMLGGGRRDTPLASKLWLNLLLESNAVPTIWIANDVDGIDPAFRRRFAYAIEFKPLGLEQRKRVWLRHLGEQTTLAPCDVERLAERYTVSAAQIATAIGAVRLATGGEPDRATLEHVVTPLEKLVLGEEPPARQITPSSGYLFEANETSCDLQALAERLSAWRPGEGPGVSLCLYGPPGTGKSEFVHHLAKRMGRPVILKRVSDILSMWVGKAEQNLAASFADAERDKAVLLFDEADSFLRDRRTARNSWEVTQVNEFLQQLERFRGVIACTTNLYRNLDQAALRRFVFKVEFKFLPPDKARLLYRTLLEPFLAAPPSANEEAQLARELARLTNLTPGDFAAVARRLVVARGFAGAAPPSALSLVTELRSEAEAKEGTARAIGF